MQLVPCQFQSQLSFILGSSLLVASHFFGRLMAACINKKIPVEGEKVSVHDLQEIISAFKVVRYFQD